MTRQPALEKRITVAWPMPRLAPVRSSVRRTPLLLEFGIGSFRLSSGIQPRLGPRLVRRVAAEFDAVVQSEWAIVPEFELRRRDAPAAPTRWSRHLADNMLGGDLGDRLFERETAFQRLRLLAGPGADLGLLRSGGEIGVRLRFAHHGHVATNAALPSQ